MSLDALLSPRGYAHRGLHNVGAGIVENSPSAVQAAIDAGVGIEIDVQMSGDRVPMVFHDEILSRLAGRDGRLAFMKASELATIPYRHGADKIMTLETCLEMVAGQVPLLIEVKSHWHGKPQMEVPLAVLLKDYAGPYGVMSFDPEVIERVRGVGLDAPIGLVPVDALYSPVRKVSYQIENTRVGQVTDYDKLSMNVETDGTVSPEDAVALAARILTDQLQLFINFE